MLPVENGPFKFEENFWDSADKFFQVYFHPIMAIGISPQDSSEEKTRKGLLSLGAFFGILAALFLGFHDVVVQFPTHGIPSFSFCMVCSLSFVHFYLTKNFQVFRFVILSSVLLTPFFAQCLHGGFARGGASIVWALGCPVCAVLAHGRARANRWFLAFLSVLALAAMIDPWVNVNFAQSTTPSPGTYFMAHIGGVSIIIFVLVQYFSLRISEEQRKSEKLLLNILPGPIAARIMQGEKTIADGFSQVTILFSDLAGFTKLSSKASPGEIVQILNRVFSEFDGLAEKHRLEKIKTIGDAYMVVGGLIDEKADSAQAVAEMALEMRDTLKKVNEELKMDLHIRIGINSGPVVAGVIGLKKFIYDLWGDAVNVASRMESTGVIDSIQVSESSFLLLEKDYLFEKRGVVEVKGKGEMTTYFLKHRRPAPVQV